MFAATATHLSSHTSWHLNEHIRHATEERIAEYEGNDRKALITRRLKELEHEWDVERTLQTNFATFSLIGLALAFKSDKRWSTGSRCSRRYGSARVARLVFAASRTAPLGGAHGERNRRGALCTEAARRFRRRRALARSERDHPRGSRVELE